MKMNELPMAPAATAPEVYQQLGQIARRLLQPRHHVQAPQRVVQLAGELADLPVRGQRRVSSPGRLHAASASLWTMRCTLSSSVALLNGLTM